MNTPETFPHQHTAHCESGVMSTLLRHQGFDADEALVFGLSYALTFVYIPLVKMAGMPLISYRSPPKTIIRRTCKALGIRLDMHTFKQPEQGMAALDAALAQGKLAGLQTSVYWLPYFPEQMRFHFNAHNLLVYGKNGSDYLISDPVFEHPQRCAAADLQRARFAKGALAAKGLMYTMQDFRQPENGELAAKIRQAIKKQARHMLAPLFFVGIKGMHHVAGKIQALSDHPDEAYRRLFLGHIVRMQEEIGTGGAGFRYLYAYFLEQAARICAEPEFQAASQELTAIGDDWRQFAGLCVRQCKKPRDDGFAAAADALRAIAAREQALWQKLKGLAA